MAINVTGSSDTLMRQAPATIELYLIEAIRVIDAQLGKGYAAKHPELLSAFIAASASDFNFAILSRAIEELAERQGSDLGFSIDQLASAVSIGTNKLAEATQNIAAMIDLKSRNA